MARNDGVLMKKVGVRAMGAAEGETGSESTAEDAYRVVIVDDFYYDLQEAVSVVEWDRLGFRVVAAVCTAEEALGVLQSSECQVLLTDVAMPKTDGIELTRVVRERFPQIKIVFMSCHTDFEYAREALQLEVCAYITKPLVPEEVERVFSRIACILSRPRADRLPTSAVELSREGAEALRERFYRSLLLGSRLTEQTVRQRGANLGLNLDDGPYRIVVWEYLSKSPENISAAEQEVRDSLHCTRPDGAPVAVVRTDEYRIVAIYSRQTKVPLDVLGSRITPALRHRLAVTADHITVSQRFASLRESATIYRECLVEAKSQKERGILDLGRVDSAARARCVPAIEFTVLQESLRAAVLSKDNGTLESIVRRLMAADRRKSSGSCLHGLLANVIVGTCLVAAEHSVSLETILDRGDFAWDTIDRVRSRRGCRKWLLGFLGQARELMVRPSHDRDASLVEMVKDYVWDHIAEPLTLEVIADHCMFSANYLNALFKRRTGETISSFVVRARIGHAKKLLERPELRLYEVAHAAGYHHLPNFNRLFRRHTGLTMSEYRTRGGNG